MGDLNVKKFGKEGDYLIKFEKTKSNDENFIENIKDKLFKNMGVNFNFRRVEDVGPKVSSELLRAGLIAIILSLILAHFHCVSKSRFLPYRKQ